MRLEDIPALRAQFARLSAESSAAWQSATPEEYQALWQEINKKRVALCMKCFGHNLELDGEYVDGEMVLDWIEHFMEASP